ncbi:MAG TPA: MBL fold metallo-hydrolase [Pseudonocardia sp.]|jgi:glyoxylase-like metal-dependent hydrolase (beta-lactamase superfamily II)|nr:MBL fold metallo-hydrolase [Pseudonocardia sp.]
MSAPVATPSGVDPRVVVFRVRDEVDVFAVRTDRFLALIDTTGTPAQCRQLLDSLGADLGRTPLVVVNTHADWDHVWGNSAVAGRAPIIAHEAALTRLRSTEAAETLLAKRGGSTRFDEVELVEPTVTFRDSLVLHGGDLTLHLLHTPGHTADHVAVWIPELRLCLAGDAAEDPIPEVTDPTPRDLQLLRRSLSTLLELRPDHVLPSHGETSSPDLLSHNLSYFDTVTERVDALPATELTAELSAELAAADALSGLGFGDCVPAARELAPGQLDFYRMCHRKAVHAAVLQRCAR